MQGVNKGVEKDATYHMGRVVRKPAFCICENKDADQLRGNREADQRLCFRYIDRTIPLLSKSEISSLYSSSVAVQPSLCQTWSEIPKTGFLTTWLIFIPFTAHAHALLSTDQDHFRKPCTQAHIIFYVLFFLSMRYLGRNLS